MDKKPKLERSQVKDLVMRGIYVVSAIGFSTGITPADSSHRHMPVFGEYYNVAGNLLWSPWIAMGAVGVAAACERKKELGTVA